MVRWLRAASGLPFLFEMGIIAELVGSLLRAVALARILPPDQFGIAISLMLVITLVDIASDIGLDKSIIRLGQDVDADVERDTLHLLSVLRGALLAALLLAAAPFLAVLFKAPGATGSFALLAVAALARGFLHLGVKEMTRDYKFGPEGLTNLALYVSTTLITIMVAWITHSYTAMVYGIVAGQVIQSLVSHGLAPQPWRLRWNAAAARKAVAYGLPLVPNGISLALKNVGDRLIVGLVAGASALAVYSVAVMVGLMPRGIVLRYLVAVFLPRMVNSGHGPQTVPIVSAFAILSGTVATVLGTGLWAIGQPVISLVFGATYLVPQPLISAVAIMMTTKILFGIVSVPVLAFGETRLVLIGSAGSLLGMAAAALTLVYSHDLAIFLLTMSLFEFTALIISIRASRGKLLFDMVVAGASLIGPMVVLLGLAIGAQVASCLDWFWRAVIGVGVLAICLPGILYLLRRCRLSLPQVWRLVRGKE
ncbi:oligosaccharide flippase family protein [Bosea beijingensis]|uniref:oligosaccharide flippase family protein n=1 Tax=Bosea beijingensis TaxID=3068632 RepID=UPI0027420027|nr:oligosaccharide flippase family protein [Bosea sp. REN20]